MTLLQFNTKAAVQGSNACMLYCKVYAIFADRGGADKMG
jgi:hypothetical protein